MRYCCLCVFYPTHDRTSRASDRARDPQSRSTLRRRFLIKSVSVAILFVFSVGGAATASAAQSGIASVYDYSGTRTAEGRWASPGSLIAAHRTLPFGTLVRVTNDRNGRSVVVRIEDRGPFVRGRVIDLTPAGAHALGFSGLARVTLTVVGRTGR